MAGKVFQRRGDAGAFEPARKRDRELRDALGIVAVRARCDDGAARLQRKVGDRREVDVDAERGEIAAEQRAEPFRERGVARRTDGHRRRQRRDAGSNSFDATAFLIDRDQR